MASPMTARGSTNTLEEGHMSSKEVNKRRGPKTPAGKLAVSHNASKHGIRSPRPVMTAFESEGAWKAHREAILESLDSVGGMEETLAERAAPNTWRLNRVAVYETESIAAEQEAVYEALRKDREHALKFADLYPPWFRVLGFRVFRVPQRPGREVATNIPPAPRDDGISTKGELGLGLG
jgi:hypothetical protein